MPRKKLPKPVKHPVPPNRVHLYDPAVDNNKFEPKKDDFSFTVTNVGTYELVISQPEEMGPKEVDPEKANLVTSRCQNGKHAPVIDIDVPIAVYPSSQLGHYHLYIDKEITWAKYERVLKALAAAGIVEDGFVKASINKNYSAVRPIGVVKSGCPDGSDVLVENAELKRKLLDSYREVDHLQKELQNGISNDILMEMQRLKSELSFYKQRADTFHFKSIELNRALDDAREEISEIRSTFENHKALSAPIEYNMTWS